MTYAVPLLYFTMKIYSTGVRRILQIDTDIQMGGLIETAMRWLSEWVGIGDLKNQKQFRFEAYRNFSPSQPFCIK